LVEWRNKKEVPVKNLHFDFGERKKTRMYNVPAPGTPPTPGLGTPTALIGPSHPVDMIIYIKNM
jgi:hypothetical protein